MNLDNFESKIDRKILLRGEDYFYEAMVREVIPLGGNRWKIKVEGSEYNPYTVTVELDGREIKSSYCDCPYDWGDVCKHEVAAYYELSESLGEYQELNKTAKEKGSSDDWLDKVDTSLLKEFLRDRMRRDLDLRNALKAEFMDSSQEPSDIVAEFMAVIEGIYREQRTYDNGYDQYYYEDDYGFDPSDEVEESINFLRRHQKISGERCAEALFEAIEYIGDQNEYACETISMSVLVDYLFELIDNGDVGTKTILFAKARKMMGANSGGLSSRQCLDILSKCAHNEALLDEVEEIFRKEIKITKENHYREYELTKVVMMYHGVLIRHKRQKEADALLRENARLDQVKQLFFIQALEDKKYNEALSIADNAIEDINTFNREGNLLTWLGNKRDVQENIGDRLGRLETMKSIVFVDTSPYSCIIEIKNDYPDQWKQVRDEIIRGFKSERKLNRLYFSKVKKYLDLLYNEDLWDQLWEELTIFSDIKTLKTYISASRHFPKKFGPLYLTQCVKRMDNASSREKYREIAQDLKLFADQSEEYCEEAVNLAISMEQQYKRRRAMIEELRIVTSLGNR
ncbi:hypothetical protein FUAX_47050 (plasmid) [Fulvitalea axinellae]|uniref:SWIM-type domain-containing protein n=1 Tax=Fulvitalea axinellae TaxID=1182444 RepID=A0AAU9CWA4_9BACT|nr:hypothetical protein FUAX_47050 [Fulvitalea axinellae]